MFSAERRTMWVAVLASMAMGLAFCALLGWALGRPILASFGAGLIPMAPSTAFMFILYTSTVFLRVHAPARRTTFQVSLVGTLAGALVALALLVLNVQGIYLAAEHLGLTLIDRKGGIPLGHMSPLSASCFLLAAWSALASLLSARDRQWPATMARWVACVLAAISFVFLLAYLYGTAFLYGSVAIPPAVTTSLAFLALSFALAGLASPQAPAIRPSGATISRGTYVVTSAFVVLAASVVVAGLIYYRRTVKEYRVEVERQLTAIAELKVSDLVQWRKERLSDAVVLQENVDFNALVQRSLSKPDDADAKARIQAWMGQVRAAYEYDQVSLLTPQGVQRLCVPDRPGPADPQHVALVSDILRSGRAMFTDFHRDAPGDAIHLAVLVPFLVGPDRRQLLAVLVLRIDPHTYVYPCISRWPAPNPTAETILVRRDGDGAVFLNEVRCKTNPAVTIGAPLERVERSAVEATLDHEGIVEGRDCRGVPVLACVHAIPDSPWFLVARLDLSEVNAPLLQRLWLLVGIVFSLLIAAGAIVGLQWRRQNLLFYRQRYEAAAERDRLSRQRQLALDAALLGWWHYDRATKSAAWDERCKAILGIADGPHNAGKVFGRVHPDDRAKVRGVSQAALAPCDPRPYSIEFRVNHPDGTVRWVEAYGVAAFEGQGCERRATSLVGTVQDITQRKRAEDELERNFDAQAALSALLRLSLEREPLAAYLDHALGVILAVKWLAIEARGMIFLADAASRTLRLEAHRGISDELIVACATVPFGRCLCGRAAESGHVQFADHIDERHDVRSAGMPPHGHYCVPIRSDNHLMGVLNLYVKEGRTRDSADETFLNSVANTLAGAIERKRADEDRDRTLRWQQGASAVQQSLLAVAPVEDKLRSVTEGIVRLFDADFCRIWLIQRGDLCGQGCLHAESKAEPHVCRHRDRCLHLVASSGRYTHRDGQGHRRVPFGCYKIGRLASGEEHRFLTNDVHNDDRVHDREWARQLGLVAFAGYQLRVPNGEVLGVLGLFAKHPIRPVEDAILDGLGSAVALAVRQTRADDARRTLEAQLVHAQKLESIGTLAGGVAHEINNPVMGIMGYAQLIADSASPGSETAKFATEIGKESERVTTIVKKLLSFARQDKEPERSPARLGEIVDDTLTLIRTVMRHDHILLEVDVPAGLPEVMGRGQQIRQVIMNLLTNARDALNDRYPGRDANKQVLIVGRSVDREGRPWVRLTVEDHGSGIPEELRLRIFDPFFTTKARDKGTGLGLSISHGIVRDHGGALSVESEVGQWTRFHVDLPVDGA